MNPKAVITQLTNAVRMNIFLLWIGLEHPAVVGRCTASSLQYLMVKTGIDSEKAKQVAQVRKEFELASEQGLFGELWFDMNVVPWAVTLSKVFDRAVPVNILEIGSWEGRSSLFLLTFFKNGHLTAVDTWSGGEEYKFNATSNLSDLERRFDDNLTSCASRLTKRKGSSMHVLPMLYAEGRRFGLIYVDGSHYADDVITDALIAWRLLDPGGVLVFDDVLRPSYRRARANPAWAIKVFLKYRKGEYEILSAGYQLILLKKISHAEEVNTKLSDLSVRNSR